ncbi:hypothetical protein EDD92_7320 [Streptomyces sp. TLI_185]|nr:hypothetical protein EDD92_7320 [Streptomyces sp. TLI_185]
MRTHPPKPHPAHPRRAKPRPTQPPPTQSESTSSRPMRTHPPKPHPAHPRRAKPRPTQPPPTQSESTSSRPMRTHPPKPHPAHPRRAKPARRSRARRSRSWRSRRRCGRAGGRAAAQPVLRGGQGDLAASAPQAARGDLDERELAAGCDGEGLWVGVGPLGLQGIAQLLHGARLGLDEIAGEGREPVEVDAHKSPAEVGEFTVAGRLDERTQGEGVVGGVGVDGRAHGDDTDDLAVRHQPGQLLGGEAVEAGGERVIRRLDVLRLEPEKMLDGGLGGERRPAQEQLPFEGRTIESAGAEHRSRRCRLRHAPHASRACGHLLSATLTESRTPRSPRRRLPRISCRGSRSRRFDPGGSRMSERRALPHSRLRSSGRYPHGLQ